MAKKREPERETERETLRICCFGDSLTAGYSSNGGVSYYTYSVALTRRLSEVLSNTQVVAVDNGMPGDVVSQAAFAQRFETESTLILSSRECCLVRLACEYEERADFF